MTAATTHDLSEAIRSDCDRALRRLDALIGERDDPVLRHVRRFVSNARALAVEQARRQGARQLAAS